ncbi:hypothetical protein [Segatella copri]|uniref:hypothetical protein n=1 Tax=Segatella copri TaxID=165179 RepID=UPI001C468E00|nr:hypothetical protein [Segatella copri]MBW0025546.1 hypothetical protein [Segatella copri]
MKLTKNDIAYLRKIGYNDNDIKEIDLGDYQYSLDDGRKISLKVSANWDANVG